MSVRVTSQACRALMECVMDKDQQPPAQLSKNEIVPLLIFHFFVLLPFSAHAYTHTQTRTLSPPPSPSYLMPTS